MPARRKGDRFDIGVRTAPGLPTALIAARKAAVASAQRSPKERTPAALPRRSSRPSPSHSARERRGAGPGWDGGRYAFMRRVLETDLGKQLYGKRQVTIEPVFANTKFNRRIDRFLRRGRSACRSEWRLITATHNLLKLHKHTTAALAV